MRSRHPRQKQWKVAEVWRAYVDESESDRRLDPDTYILAAALVQEDHHDEIRDDLRRRLRPGQRKLHWHDESDQSRKAITEAVAALPALHVIVVRDSRPGESPERRRRKCFERLAYELHQRGVRLITAEARERKQNAREVRYFNTLRAGKVIDRSMRLWHITGPAEPLLWIPDAVAGAVTAARTGTPLYLQMLDDVVDLVQFDLL